MKVKLRYRYFFTKNFPKVYASLTHFKEKYNFNSNTCAYNNVIYAIYEKYENYIELIDFYKMTEENSNLLLDEGIHITKKAHSILSNILYKKIINSEKI